MERNEVRDYFGDRDAEREIYETFEAAVLKRWPETRIKVHKTQISFYNRHLFVVASLPYRRMKDWPEECLLVTFGLEHELDHPRIAVATEPHPRRWTHHVVVASPEDVDEELMEWVAAAWTFSMEK
ncbi:DUF5655 domain-containing protein [Corynebacterium sp.]|uniref:DUF5655 domain-containing protein n=1 Tax=Corynebacterium sp. TaxID=1720 RepID=UPI0026E011FC|nr:DUF5655 domain-containing protein [Corynebacterium sp.]MDO5511294.1 DUF5655 domain-containing protein [Corynebacterium sp.]